MPVGVAAETDPAEVGVRVEQGAHQGGRVVVRAVWLGGVATDDENVANAVVVEPRGDAGNMIRAFDHPRREVGDDGVAEIDQLARDVEGCLQILDRRSGDRHDRRGRQMHELEVCLGSRDQLEVGVADKIDDHRVDVHFAPCVCVGVPSLGSAEKCHVRFGSRGSWSSVHSLNARAGYHHTTKFRIVEDPRTEFCAGSRFRVTG